jgi:hypothetical protein
VRAAAHEVTPAIVPPTIDKLFDPAKGANWRGIGWENPLVSKITLSPDPEKTEPNAPTALPLDGKTDLVALLGHGPVILGDAGGTSWLLAVAMTEGGIVANDPLTATRVLLSYDSATKTIGKMFDPASKKWIALSDAAKAGIDFVDDVKVAVLQAFTAKQHLTVTLIK